MISVDQINLPAVGEKLSESFGYVSEKSLSQANIIVMPLASKVTVSDIRKLAGCESGEVIVCDFKIEGIEQGEQLPNLATFSLEKIINIDHHASLESMFKPISSANLAIEYVRLNGAVNPEIPIVVNHYDCDSVLSALIMRGILPPLEVFGDAVIAADHTGVSNPIADLLQSFKDQRDFEFSARNLALFLRGQTLETKAEELLAQRLATRDSLARLPAIKIGAVVLIKTDGRVDAELFPGVYPEASVVMSYHRREDDHWEVRLRLCKSAPEGLNLQKLNIRSIDPAFGGRWNAGSNERGGGTALDPQEYARRLSLLL